jgi:hypothetical protein
METVEITGSSPADEFIKVARCYSTYRGVANTEFDLIPTIGRFENYSPAMEQMVFAEFRDLARPHFPESNRTEWEWLFLAQHYGLPTRLLDWTSSLLTSLYFASLGTSPSDFAVFAIQTGTWSEYPKQQHPLSSNISYFLRPPHIDQRITAQNAFFSIHDRPNIPWRPENLVRFVFRGEDRDSVQWALRFLGITHRTVFPDIGGVIQDIVHDIPGICNPPTPRQTMIQPAPNRVGAGIEPAPPTPPGMRV